MFKTYSKAGVGIVLMFITIILQMFGVEVDEGSKQELALAIMEVVAAGLVIWGQIDRKSLHFGLIRK